jgi:TfoX/Sxy family transcriptional regulator of competence genes
VKKMAYSKALDKQIIEIISIWGNVIPKEMFGGVCYLLNGNIVCGVYKDFLILRLGVEGAALALQHPQVRAFDITGRAMKGWVMVEEQACVGKRLEDWLNKARAFVSRLPEKRH